MKTEKYNNMISAFQCDFTLAKENIRKLGELDIKLKNKDKSLFEDIDLLEELEYMLRTGKAEIHIIEE